MFGKKVKVEKSGILRLKLRTKLLDYIGEKGLTTNELEQLENDIFEIFEIKEED